MQIDVHAHIVPEPFIDLAALEGRPNHYAFRIEHGLGDPWTQPPLMSAGFEIEQMFNLERRLAEMDAQYMDMQVLSTTPHLFFYNPTGGAMPSQAAITAMCRTVNNTIAGIVAQHPTRFVAIADVPLPDGEAAAAELERAVRELGFRGAEICTNIGGRNLDDRAFFPFYAKAQELDVPIVLHPANVLGLDRLRDYYLNNLIGNPSDSGVAAASLIFGGVLKEFPRIKFYLAHAGGTCPLLRGRWEHGWKVRPEAKKYIQRPPSEYFKLLYFDTLSHYVPGLNFLVDTVGYDRLMVGTDYPFDMGDYNTHKTVEAIASLNTYQKERIYGGTAAEMFRIG